MAKNRSRRLRKKLHLAEFQEVGFSVAWQFAANTQLEEIDEVLNAFLHEVIDPHQLAFEGGGYLEWDGLVYLREIGQCSEQHREVVKNWLTAKGAENVVVSELFDIWWD